MIQTIATSESEWETIIRNVTSVSYVNYIEDVCRNEEYCYYFHDGVCRVSTIYDINNWIILR